MSTLPEIIQFYVNTGHHTCAGIVLAACSYGKDKNYIGFEVLTAVVMKNSIFWKYHHVVRWRSTDVSEENLATIFNHEFGHVPSKSLLTFKRTTRR
jgi:hypothetical protein